MLRHICKNYADIRIVSQDDNQNACKLTVIVI